MVTFTAPLQTLNWRKISMSLNQGIFYTDFCEENKLGLINEVLFFVLYIYFFTTVTEPAD